MVFLYIVVTSYKDQVSLSNEAVFNIIKYFVDYWYHCLCKATTCS